MTLAQASSQEQDCMLDFLGLIKKPNLLCEGRCSDLDLLAGGVVAVLVGSLCQLSSARPDDALCDVLRNGLCLRRHLRAHIQRQSLPYSIIGSSLLCFQAMIACGST